MKAIYNKIAMLFILSLALWSCDKDEDRIIIKDGVGPVISSSQTNLVLVETDKDKDAVTFSWERANFGYNAAASYALEFDVEGNNFATPQVVEVESGLVRTFKVGELNNIANFLEMTGFQPGGMEVRVKATVGNAVDPVYSDPISLTVTPYLAEPEYPVIYLVGAAAENGWDNTKATPFFRNEEDPFVYTLTTQLTAGDFKLLGMLGKWGPAWGMGEENEDGSIDLNFRPTEGDPDVPNFTGLVPADGFYTITVSLRDNTVKVEPFAGGATAPTYSAIGLVGEFSNWGANPDVMMTRTSANSHIWTATLTLANASEVKFRVNQDWGTNWGAGADVSNWYGKGSFGSSNIKMTAGTYLVQFNDLTGEYVFIEQ
ncbi:SusE domain-containing protein [Rufibacter psychrotolerans]|uniref:SusE domain-containing protein n=1 Tax=Rufibacter psychrotolerans TaxID=2812556 RepID=UPI00196757B8|nr:SusE domain-containing protein [Rufibacter sp. SYSU D00308]